MPLTIKLRMTFEDTFSVEHIPDGNISAFLDDLRKDFMSAGYLPGTAVPVRLDILQYTGGTNA